MDVVRKWGPTAAVNLVLGVLAVVPLWLTALFVLSLLSAGTESASGGAADDLVGRLRLLLPPWVVLIGLWIPANILVRRGTGASKCRHWVVGSGLLLTPLPALAALMYLVEG
ncbi:hypothetical protein FB570_107217 [Streptomyces sp. T12]|uniref:hypothetical protein n=1 Tax=Streptomyces sp. T12 TaxID=477697 RepID=UPI0011A4A8C4|nr:hypothetical protein [Streptomyces sp. T12]TWD20412.1 hypothetical protein FB570_107217 [Streptomyces sp. T12]